MSIVDDAGEDLKIWKNFIVNNKIENAANLCEDNINKYKKFHQNCLDKESNLLILTLRLAIIFKGLQEFSYLVEFLNIEDWHTNTKNVEYYWYQLCDSKDRFIFTKSYFSSPIVDSVIKEIDDIENLFDETFGDSYYSSPEILIDKFVCTICGIDVRGCSHQEGKLYEGKVCRYRAINPSIRAVALVKSPKDRRCRIWSWNVQEDNKVETMILAAFTVDDFFYE